MKIRITSIVSALVLALGVSALPAYAQGPPSITGLAKVVADLSARVAKLEGNISAADLAGTYAVHTIDNQVSAIAGQSMVHPQVSAGTVTLAADGTGTLTSGACGGFFLQLPTNAVTPENCSGQLHYPFAWKYADGILTETIQTDFGPFDVLFDVGVGGRVMTTSFAPYNPFAGAGDTIFIILTRLN
jgi:hypothetical protein